ncbi:MAG: helix-turn-helix domain-containing protein, partial [Pseudomonadota bacterium]
QRLGEAGSSKLRFDTLLAFVRECRSRLARPAPFDLSRALTRTAASRGAVRVSALCAELGISRKHLGVLFRQSVGLTPKGFARLARFRAAMARMENANAIDFAELALDLGFSDQAHLINDFTTFAGDPPGRFLKVRAVDGETVLYDL